MNAFHSRKLQDALRLPPPVPWLGAAEMGFMGGGLVGCGTDPYGVWNNLVGPAYSMDTFIRKERLKAIIDGIPFTLKGEMHRAAGTGVFYSTHCFQDVVVYVTDFAVMRKPYITRIIAAHNTSRKAVEFNPYVEIKRAWHASYHPDMKRDGAVAAALTLVQPDSRFMTVAFAGHKTAVRIHDEETEVVLDTEKLRLAPDETRFFALYHLAHSADQSTQDAILAIDGKDGISDLHDCISEWGQWLASGRDLGFIKDERARDIVESSAIIIRMQQGENGGIMATPGAPTSSYVRDNHSSLRGMMALGHTDEAREYLLFANSQINRLIADGHFGVPTSFPIGLKQPPFFGFGNEDNWSCETPGLYVLTAKRYYELTNDAETLKTLDVSLRYAIKVQLDFARAHDWRLIFNGDETESGGCGITMTDSITADKKWLSMPSMVICIASLKFFIDYLTLQGRANETPEYESALAHLRQSLDDNFWNEELGIYHWFRTFDNVMSKTRMCNFQIMPLYFGDIGGRERAARSALDIKRFIGRRGFVPNQPLGENNDFCGHNLGYLLNAMTELNDPVKDKVYETLINGGTVGCWGMWAEAYYDDGTPYGYGQTWDNRPHNLRPFETGVNIEAIVKYWESVTSLPPHPAHR